MSHLCVVLIVFSMNPLGTYHIKPQNMSSSPAAVAPPRPKAAVATFRVCSSPGTGHAFPLPRCLAEGQASDLENAAVEVLKRVGEKLGFDPKDVLFVTPSLPGSETLLPATSQLDLGLCVCGAALGEVHSSFSALG